MSSPLHILVAEDNADNCRLLTLFLRKLGLEAECVSNGLEALRMLREHPGRYRLFLTDLRMPGMDGFEAVRQLRAGACGAPAASIPVMAVSAMASEADRRNSLTAGADEYLSKPFLFSQFSAALERAVRRREAIRAA